MRSEERSDARTQAFSGDDGRMLCRRLASASDRSGTRIAPLSLVADSDPYPCLSERPPSCAPPARQRQPPEASATTRRQPAEGRSNRDGTDD
jgi:hypothetical protein